MPLKFGHIAYQCPDVTGHREILLRHAGIPGVGLAQRLFRFPALQPRPPHREFSAQYQDLYFSHRVRGARLVGHQAGMRSARAQRYQADLGADPPHHRSQHRHLSQQSRRRRDRILLRYGSDIDEELGFFEPRPWHQDRPQRPKVWGGDTPSNWWGPMSHGSPQHAQALAQPAAAPVHHGLQPAPAGPQAGAGRSPRQAGTKKEPRQNEAAALATRLGKPAEMA